MAKKIFISFLGTGHYKKCMYRYTKTTKSESVSFIQEATLKYLIKSLSNTQNPWSETDIAYILLTQEARKKNWVDGWEFEDENGNSDIQEEGLETRLIKLKKKHPVLNYISVDISEDSSKNIWMLFDDLYDLLVTNEPETSIDLYIDVTHSYRYLPMFLIVFINYVKMFKDIKVKHISYGNWEDRDEDTNEAPIVDLTDYSKLQDWTYATRSYMESGNAKSLYGLLKDDYKQLADSIKQVSDDFLTCRSIPIVKGNHIKEMRDKIGVTNYPHPPFKKLMESIDKQVEPFSTTHISDNYIDSDNVKNGYRAAFWCYKNGLYEQAITILQENIITENIVLRKGQNTDSVWMNGYGPIPNPSGEQDYKNCSRSTLPLQNNNNVSFGRIDDQDLKMLYEAESPVRNDYDHAGFTQGGSDNNPTGWTSQEVIRRIDLLFSYLENKIK